MTTEEFRLECLRLADSRNQSLDQTLEIASRYQGFVETGAIGSEQQKDIPDKPSKSSLGQRR